MLNLVYLDSIFITDSVFVTEPGEDGEKGRGTSIPDFLITKSPTGPDKKINLLYKDPSELLTGSNRGGEDMYGHYGKNNLNMP